MHILFALVLAGSLLVSSAATPQTSAYVQNPSGEAAASTGVSDATRNTAQMLAMRQFSFKSDGASLEKILAEIHQQCKIDVLADDTPLLNSQNVNLQGSLSDSLKAICDLYDYTYSASTSPRPVVYLRKRFRNPVDIPQLHEQSIRQMAEDVCACLSSRLYQPGEEGQPIGLMWILYHTFDDGQIARLKSGARLTFDALKPSQALLIRRAIYSTVFQTMTDGWIRLRNRMRDIKQSYLTVEFDSVGRRRLLLISPALPERERQLVLRWLPEDVVISPREPDAKPAASAKSLLRVVDPSSGPPERERARQRIDIDVERSDLQTLIEKLSLVSGFRITSDDYLAPHTLTAMVTGVTARQILNLVAELNGWRLIGDEQSGIQVKGPVWHAVEGVAEVASEIRKATPLDYKSFLGIQVDLNAWKMPDEPEAWKNLSDISQAKYRLMQKLMNPHFAKDKAAERIWKTVPAEADNGGKYRYRDWPTELRNAVLESLIRIMVAEASYFTSRAFEILNGFNIPYELNPEITEVFVSGGSYGFGISRATPDGIETTGVHWELNKAERPLPPKLMRALEGYK